MLSKKFRLTKKDNIGYILNQGGTLSNDFFIFKILPNANQNFKFCLIISSKFKLDSIKRNRLRRQIYEALRLNYDLLKIKKTNNIAIIVRNPVLKADYQMIEKKIIQLLKQLNPNP